MDRLIESLDESASWSDLSETLARTALEIAELATTNTTSADNFYEALTCPEFGATKITKEELYAMIMLILLRDRARVLTLYRDGMLPGYALFLLAVWKLLPPGPVVG